MRSTALLVFGLVGLGALSALWVASLCTDRVRWQRRYAQIYLLLLLLTAWQMVWHEVNFELVLLSVTVVAGLSWLLARVPRLPWHLESEQRRQLQLVGAYAPLLLAVVLVRSFWYEPFQIPTESMRPTLQVGDFLLVSKFAYGLRVPGTGQMLWDTGSRPERGDIVVFDPPGISRRYIKRVVGIPGDSISYRQNDELRINGELVRRTNPRFGDGAELQTEHLSGCRRFPVRFIRTRMGGLQMRLTEVPARHYLMLGDNRDNSYDSRGWGLVPFERIYGRADWRWLYWPSLFSLPSLDRFGSLSAVCHDAETARAGGGTTDAHVDDD